MSIYETCDETPYNGDDVYIDKKPYDYMDIDDGNDMELDYQDYQDYPEDYDEPVEPQLTQFI